MAAHDYVLRSVWRVAASPEEAAGILSDAAALPRWWSAVYLSVDPEDNGVWRVHSRGWLPYTLRWRFQQTQDNGPAGFALRAWGDLNGFGEWRFVSPAPGWTHVYFEWRVRAEKPLLRALSWLLKPLFAANHRWAMAQGEIAFRGEVIRRRLLHSASHHGDMLDLTGHETPLLPRRHSATRPAAGPQV